MDTFGYQFHAVKEETRRETKKRLAEQKKIDKETVWEVNMYAWFWFRLIEQADLCV